MGLVDTIRQCFDRSFDLYDGLAAALGADQLALRLPGLPSNTIEKARSGSAGRAGGEDEGGSEAEAPLERSRTSSSGASSARARATRGRSRPAAGRASRAR
jgi:hypothetical protein